ncbi:DUF1049 domain-containing protein [Micromonospora sp. U56]|nr:DUF1049 domain-containing protein [Micromonospora sp. U56]
MADTIAAGTAEAYDGSCRSGPRWLTVRRRRTHPTDRGPPCWPPDAQNGQRAEVSFLGAHGHLPMGVALLLAAVFGILLVALPGTARIVQLRMLQRRPAGNPDARPRPGPLSPTVTGTARVTPKRSYRQDR